MVFTMLCLKKQLLKLCRLWLYGLALAGLTLGTAWADSGTAEVTQLTSIRLDKQLAISANIRFELPLSIEEAMYKGVSLTFVSELDITRERWYWADKTVASASRQIRISYQALTRRWRVVPWSEMGATSGLGVQLAQTYETLQEALGMAQRIHNWRVAEWEDALQASHWVSLRYRLDISQLPKPLQIGLLGQGDWTISAIARQRLIVRASPQASISSPSPESKP
jgi:Domain of unknown function (DUF4390)